MSLPQKLRLSRERLPMRCSSLLITAILLLVLSGLDRSLAVPPTSVVPHEAVPQDEHADETLLLTKSGRMIQGVIRHSPNGYIVEKATGQIVVPFDLVRFEATDLQDAYAKLHKAMPYATASQHMALAQWCLINDLFKKAREELQEALLLEPQRKSARTMLKRLENVMAPSKTLSSRSSSAGPSEIHDVPQVLEARSLAGLTREQGRTYIQTIQPILMNKCANASCHGSEAANAFHLTRIHPGRGSHRVFAERNLAVVLKFINRADPSQSPLLTRPVGNHGKGGKTIFFGTSGARQSAALREWVRAVAGGQQEPSMREQSWPALSVKGDDEVPARSENIPNSDRSIGKPMSSASENTSPLRAEGSREQEEEIKQADFLEELLRDKKPDAFDPAIFNRETQNSS